MIRASCRGDACLLGRATRERPLVFIFYMKKICVVQPVCELHGLLNNHFKESPKNANLYKRLNKKSVIFIDNFYIVFLKFKHILTRSLDNSGHHLCVEL